MPTEASTSPQEQSGAVVCKREITLLQLGREQIPLQLIRSGEVYACSLRPEEQGSDQPVMGSAQQEKYGS